MGEQGFYTQHHVVGFFFCVFLLLLSLLSLSCLSQLRLGIRGCAFA